MLKFFGGLSSIPFIIKCILAITFVFLFGSFILGLVFGTIGLVFKLVFGLISIAFSLGIFVAVGYGFYLLWQYLITKFVSK